MTILAAWCAVALARPEPLPDNHVPRAGNPPVEAAPAPAPELAAEEGARLEVDAKVPAEILVSGVKLGQLYFPGEASFKIVPGEHVLRIYVNGQPTDLPVTLRAGERTRVLVGRSGVSLEAADEAGASPVVEGPVAVQFRLAGDGTARVVLDGRPVASLQPGAPVMVDVGVGVHPLSVRSGDGTAIWATGSLEVQGGDGLVVQVAEGRMPEVSGPGVFH
ncbi:MAG: hypothetical protein R3F59_03035 [Myxococcota bacterium]